MALRERLIPWTEQPQEWAAPDEQFSLTSLVVPGLSRHDIAADLALSSASGTISNVVARDGAALRTAGAQASVYATAKPSQKSPSVSILWAGEFLGAAGAAACLGGITYDSANSSPYVFAELKRNQSSDNNIFFTHSDSTSFRNVSIAGSYVSGPVVIIATCRPNQQFAYVRTSSGIASGSATTAAALNSASTARLEIGESLNARNPNADCSLFAMASRAWTEVEVMSLLANPWQLFQPRRIWIPQAGIAGLPTLSAATFVPGSLTASGFRPRVTATY